MSFLSEREKVWQELSAKYAAESKAKEAPIKVTLPNGDVKEFVAFKSTPLDVAASISKGLMNATIVAKVNGAVYDAWRPLESDCLLELCKFESPEGKHTFWHSSAHILGQALENLLNAHLCIGPPLDGGGFYYEAVLPEGRTIKPEDLVALNAEMLRVVEAKQPFERIRVSKEDALKLFYYNALKSEIIRSKVPDGDTCTVYRCGSLIDLCRGPHVLNTGVVKAIETTKVSSSYFLGDSKRESLQRVYGISFPSAKELKEHKRVQEEAAARDHRRIGVAHELFFFHDLSPGCAFFLPRGAHVYQKLVDLLLSEYHKRGFTPVITPNMFKSKLWETSGHWQHYKDNMFSLEQVEGETFALKPMNCPGHCLIYGSRTRSHREMPLRLAEFGVLHRNEISGALSGLTRVRRFVCDDAHIFCMPSQIGEEIRSALQFMSHVYGIFGFSFSLELSTRPANYVGSLEIWEQAESTMQKALEEYGAPWKLNPGDGAFYGPKIDIHVKDALGRSFQCATVQLDFQLPSAERFALKYIDVDNREHQPVIIHRAIFGSVERFMAILIEHTAGKWPFWISPRQVVVLPVAEKHHAYAELVRQRLHDEHLVVDVDNSSETISKKIRNAQLGQYNFILVVGDEEIGDSTVNVRTRDNVVHGKKKVEDFVNEAKAMIAKYE